MNSKYKSLSLLLWIGQLGCSIIFPLCFFIFAAIWLQNRFGWGDWIFLAGVLLGIVCAVDGLKTSIKAMIRMSGQEEEKSYPISFNDHE